MMALHFVTMAFSKSIYNQSRHWKLLNVCIIHSLTVREKKKAGKAILKGLSGISDYVSSKRCYVMYLSVQFLN